MSSFGEPIASASVELRADTSKLEPDVTDGVLGLKSSLAKASRIWDDVMADAEKAGESVQSSFEEAGRQSDAALEKIGGPDVWGDVKRESASAGDAVERNMRNAATHADAHLGRISSAGAGLFRVVSTAAAAFGGALLFKTAIDQASDLNESINAVNVMFGTAADGVHALAESAATDLGLTQGQFNGLAVSFGAFATTIAGPTGDVAATLGDLTGRAADFASVMNLEVNDAATLFQSGLAGETEPLRKYGLDLSAAAVEAFALANGISDGSAQMTEAQKVTARYGLLMQQTAKVQGDFKNTSGELANGLRILKAQTLETGASFGAAFLPGLKEVVGGLNGLVTSLAEPLAQLGTSIGATLGPLLTALGPAFGIIIRQAAKIMEDFASILASIAPLIAPIIQVVGVLATAFTGVLARAFKALEPAIAVLAKFLDSFAELLGNVLFDAIDAILPALASLGDFFAGVLSTVLPIVTSLFEEMSPVLNEIATILSGVFAAVLPVIANAFTQVFTALAPLIPILADFLLTTLQAIAPILPQIATSFIELALAFVPVLTSLLPIIDPLLQLATLLIDTIGVPVLTALATAFGLYVDVQVKFAELLGAVLVPVVNALTDAIMFVVAHVQEWWDKTEGIRAFFEGAFAVALGGLIVAFGGVRDAIQFVWDKTQALWDLLEPVRSFLAGAFAAGIAVATAGFGLFVGAVGFVITKSQELWDLLEPIRGFLAGVWSTAVSGAKLGLTFFGDAFGFVADKASFLWNVVLSPLVSWLGAGFAAGFDAAKAVLGGIRDAFQWVIDKVELLIGWIAKIHFPDIPSWMTPFSGAGDFVNSVVAKTQGLPSGHGAVGMISSRPRIDLWGEAGKEAMIPVTMPGRAMQLMHESGLGAMWDKLSGAGSGWTGDALHIDQATFLDATDAESVAQKVNVAVMTRMVTS